MLDIRIWQVSDHSDSKAQRPCACDRIWPGRQVCGGPCKHVDWCPGIGRTTSGGNPERNHRGRTALWHGWPLVFFWRFPANATGPG